MIIVGDLKFEIKHKDVFLPITERSVALEKTTDFICEYTTLNQKGATQLIEMIGLDEAVEFIMSKISIDNDSSFAKTVNSFVKKIETDISYIIMLELNNIGYKISDMVKLNRIQLFEILMLELMSKQNSIDVNNFIMNIEKRYSKANVDGFKKLFNINKKEEESKDNIEELINELDGI